jgi:hypothetical protein
MLPADPGKSALATRTCEIMIMRVLAAYNVHWDGK